jgi:hypothetical protein
VAALADYLSKGHRLIYIMGNHDREFHFPAVKETFISAIERNGALRNLNIPRDNIQFEPWFYYVPGRIYAEHGHQYDYYSTFTYILAPVVKTREEEVIALPMGNLSNRYLMSNMGFFNPFTTDFILNVFNYIHHWLKHYALSRYSLVVNWIFGAFLVLGKLLKLKEIMMLHPPQNHKEQITALGRRFHMRPDTVEALYRLKRPPITNKVYRMVREFWIDRVLLAIIMIGGTLTLALVPIPLWIKLMVPLSSFPLLYLIYEWFAHGITIFSAEKESEKSALRISTLLPVKVITFGHTHAPGVKPIVKDIYYVNTGTWAPIIDKKRERKLIPGFRNFLILTFNDERPHLQFGSWFEARDVAIEHEIPTE